MSDNPKSRAWHGLAAAALLTTAAMPAFAAPTPAPVVAAERAFAADETRMGIKGAFLKHSAPDGIVIQAEPQSVADSFKGQPDPASPEPLTWWPLWAAISGSGDLGFTSGPFAVEGKPRGWYFTVWAKQPSGRWQWIFDGGVGASATNMPPAGSQPSYLAAAKARAGSAGAAMAEVRKAEAALAERAKKDASAAYLEAYAADGRMHDQGAPPAIGREQVARAVEARAGRMTFKALGGRASKAGDLAWTYGEAGWSKSGRDLRGHYVRIWRDSPGGWALVFDEIIPVPPARPS